MAAAASESSGSTPSIFPLSPKLPTRLAGRENPIKLPLIEGAAIFHSIGKRIAHGSNGEIYNVDGSNPPRVYKVIPITRFFDGNEIRVCKIAAQIGVAPAFYGACLLVQEEYKFVVVIEMDYGGNSLSRLIRDLEPKPTEILSTEEAIEKLYASQEGFYFELFTACKTLAENRISYRDINYENLLPNIGKKFYLIDFDLATFEKSVKDAASATVANDVLKHFSKFCALKDLSAKSKELIEWFQTQCGYKA